MKKLLSFLLMFLALAMLTGMTTASASTSIGLMTEVSHLNPADAGAGAVMIACLACQKENLMGPPTGTLSLLMKKGSSISPVFVSLHNPGQTYLPDIAG